MAGFGEDGIMKVKAVTEPELSLESPEDVAERLKKLEAPVEAPAPAEAVETPDVIAEDAAKKAREDAVAVEALVTQIKGKETGEVSATEDAGKKVSEAELDVAFEEASLINASIDKRSADGKPLDAAALERLRHASSEEIDRKIELLQSKAGQEYLAKKAPQERAPDAMPEKKVEEMPADPEIVQAGEEALAYVVIPDGEFGADSTRNTSLSNGRGFERALGMKKLYNKEIRKRILASSIGAGAVSMVGGMSAIAAGGAGSTAAFYGGVALLGGGGGFLILGGSAYLVKKLYDRYKEKKAEKAFDRASVARAV